MGAVDGHVGLDLEVAGGLSLDMWRKGFGLGL